MKRFLISWPFAFSLIFAITASLPFISTAPTRRNYYFFQITLTTTNNGFAQFFYDIGNSINEHDSTYIAIDKTQPAFTYKFPIPPGTYRALRFDPIDNDGTVTISNAKIIDRNGITVKEFPPDRFSPANQISNIQINGDTAVIYTEKNGRDPYFDIKIDKPFRLKISLKYWLKSALPIFILVLVISQIISLIPLHKPIHNYFSSLLHTCSRHPFTTISIVSALVALISCHPVVFSGRSFVSPDNGVLLLYDQFPTLPGYKSAQIENARWSDVGAVMWWHLYCPVIARDALLKDSQLPLWNRYSMSGVPLLGQGQSMFGEPLNWISIFADSAAWSWDIRFVIARWLLCCGLGFTVYVLVKSLPVSLLIAIGGGCLGYFSFRLNHPASFSVCYGPWILFSWLKICSANTQRYMIRWCIVLAAVNFSVMTSGSVKEAYAIILCLNICGFSLLTFGQKPILNKLSALATTAGTGILFIFATAPLWMSFLTSLRHSATDYDRPSASQIPPTLMLGFFDDLFSSQLRQDEIIYNPSVNFLFLIGILSAIVHFRSLSKERSFIVISLCALIPISLVYGIVDSNILIRIPFIANIAHIDNTFSCALIIFTAILAGFGFSPLVAGPAKQYWLRDYAFYLLLLGAMVLSFWTHVTKQSAFFRGYSWSQMIAVIIFPIGLYIAKKTANMRLLTITLVFVVGLTTWRHCQYVHTSSFDNYVFNPKIRADLHAPSPAVDFAKSDMLEPSRAFGFELNLFAGYNQMLRLESILGVDPLRNRYHDELAAALGITRVRSADNPVLPDQYEQLSTGFDLLNVGYFFSLHKQEPRIIPGLKLIGQFDLDVYRSETVWPRAFFTDRLCVYDNVGQFVEKVKNGDRRPFAAVEVNSVPQSVFAGMPTDNLGDRTITPATNYRLTTNTTSFRISAPSAGVIVLSESYYPDDFNVIVNGTKWNYFRINHAFKGIYIDKPGIYEIEYKFWPEKITYAFGLSFLGIIGFIGLAVVSFWPISQKFSSGQT